MSNWNTGKDFSSPEEEQQPVQTGPPPVPQDALPSMETNNNNQFAFGGTNSSNQGEKRQSNEWEYDKQLTNVNNNEKPPKYYPIIVVISLLLSIVALTIAIISRPAHVNNNNGLVKHFLNLGAVTYSTTKTKKSVFGVTGGGSYSVKEPSKWTFLNRKTTYVAGGTYRYWASPDREISWRDGLVKGFPDVWLSPGDKVLFRSPSWGYTWDDVWDMGSQTVYDNCDFSKATQLAPRMWLNTADYPNGWTFVIDENKYKDGDIIYIASGRDWNRDSRPFLSCKKYNFKFRIRVYKHKELPILENDDVEIADNKVIQDLKAAVGKIGRVLILNQFSFEQRIRTRGQSGLTNVRGHNTGDYAYHDGTYSNGAAASIHNHANTKYVVGIGEIEACLNGVCFQTRHNDYNIRRPSGTSTRYHATEEMPQPAVPPSVTKCSDINCQIKEMQQYFLAFKKQDESIRKYKPYFKPVLCALEGTYIIPEADIEEPFDSDRHFIDAKTWESLHNKIRYMANSGRKNSAENLAHLPGVLRYLVNSTWPVLSNWEYRIICTPLKNDIPTSRFQIADDLHIQIQSSPKTRDELYYDRRSRFKLNTYINLNNMNDHRWSPSRRRWDYLDYLMEQLPGKDNRNCNLTDQMPDGTERVIHYNSKSNNPIPLNSCKYSRYYQLVGADAMGASSHRRSYSDAYMWAAQTSQKKVSPIQFDFEINNKVVPTISRWSYAIPLEIIYLTPLSTWNPYNIEYKTGTNAGSVTAGGRNGLCKTASQAFNGANSGNYFLTPSSFFSNTNPTAAADTSGGATCVLDKSGTVRTLRASGHWITFPEIGGGVGLVRQRYPIFPIHEAGSATWKEVKALQAIILSDQYDNITSPEVAEFFGPKRDIQYGFKLLLAGGGHQHNVYLPGWKVKNAWWDSSKSEYIKFTKYTNYIIEDSEWRNGHTHTVNVSRIYSTTKKLFVYKMLNCRFGDLKQNDMKWDNMGSKCADGHNEIQRD